MDERTGANRGTALGRWLQQLPKPVRWSLMAILLLCYYAVVLLVLTWIHHEPVAWSRPLPFMGGVIGAAIGLWLRRRRVGGPQRLREYTKALKSGVLPADADPSEWRSLLAREERALGRAAVATYVVLGLVAALQAVVAAVRSSGWMEWLGWALVAVLVVTAALIAWAGRRQRRRIERLAAQLPEEAVPAS